MLFRAEFLEGIRAGTVTLAFRRWRRPSVRTGGTLLTPVGQIGITSVTAVPLSQISAVDARRAGYDSLVVLQDELQSRVDGEIYRIELGPLRPDPRIALRATPADTGSESQGLEKRLARLDTMAPDGAWTFRALAVISSHPGVRAADLCRMLDQEKARFKLNVRKLKTLGLTESLETGYRLSLRGESLLRALRSRATENQGKDGR